MCYFQFPGKTTIDCTQEEAERTLFSHQKRRRKEDFIAAFNAEIGRDYRNKGRFFSDVHGDARCNGETAGDIQGFFSLTSVAKCKNSDLFAAGAWTR